MTQISFKIGEEFPADDPVARFITVVAMISNDWLRLWRDMTQLDGDGEDEETRARLLTNYRLQAALHYEAAAFLRTSRSRFSEVRDFVDGLPPTAREEYDRVVGGIDPGSEYFHGKWLKDNRNRAFHYSKLNRGEPIGKALRAVAGREGRITAGESFDSVRFGFADTVAVQWLPAGEDSANAMKALRVSVVALAQFAQRAARAYLTSRGIGPDDA